MNVKGIFLNWIVVNNIESAITFYTQVVGLQLKEYSKEYKWAELSGPEGSVLGIAEESEQEDKRAGTDAVVTITVQDLEKACIDLVKKGGHLLGDMIEIPGHVKLQSFEDPSGNKLQLVQQL